MRKLQSLKFKQILIISLTVLITGSVISIFGRIEAGERIEEGTEDTLTAYAEQLAHSYGFWIDKELSQLALFAEYLTVDYDDPEFYALLASEAERSGFNSMSPVDLNGILHLSGGRTADLSGRDYLQELFRTKQPVISDPVFSVVEGEKDLFTILVAVPIFRDGQLAGALIGQKNADFLGQVLDTISYDKIESMYVLNSEGTTIAHTDYQNVVDKFNVLTLEEKDPSLYKLTEIVKRMVKGEQGTDEYTYKNVTKIVAFAPIEGTSWSAAIASDRKVVLSSVNEMGNAFTLITLIVGGFGILLAFILGKTLTKPIIQLNDAMDEIARGEADLTRRLELNRKDEMEQLAQAFNKFLIKLASIITALRGSQASLEDMGNELSSTAQETASAINQIMANIEGVKAQAENLARNTGAAASSTLTVTGEINGLGNLIDEQVDSSSEASSVIEEMIANIREVGNSVARMAESSRELTGSMEESREKQSAMDKRIQEIASQSELLMEANDVISGIASQTNLLAMNAAIEAAHAGEAGRGFSVVADEIRKLAENSSEQSHKIGSELARIKETIQEVVGVSKTSQAAFALVSSGIEEMEGIVKQVDQAMQEQGEGSRQVLGALEKMNSIGSQVKEKAVGMKKVTEEAARAMDNLTESSLVIQGSMDEMAAGAEQINKAAGSVSSLAESTNGNIKAMDEQIGKFIV